MPRALIIGGTGQIGRATAGRLLAAGWQVDLTGRDPAHMPAEIAAAGGKFVVADRDNSEQLLVALGDGADLLVDCICYTAAAATQLLPLVRNAGSTVMISSKAVYVDAFGRHSNSESAPRFDGPIGEEQPTMAPGHGDYNSREGYGANKVAAENVLLDSGEPVTVLRPSKIHGVGAQTPREWVFVKRVLDRRPAVFLARQRRRHRPSDGRCEHRRADRGRRRETGSEDPQQRRPRRAQRARDLTHDRPSAEPPTGRRCCSATMTTRRWAGIPGTRPIRSCST